MGSLVQFITSIEKENLMMTLEVTDLTLPKADCAAGFSSLISVTKNRESGLYKVEFMIPPYNYFCIDLPPEASAEVNKVMVWAVNEGLEGQLMRMTLLDKQKGIMLPADAYIMSIAAKFASMTDEERQSFRSSFNKMVGHCLYEQVKHMDKKKKKKKNARKQAKASKKRNRK